MEVAHLYMKKREEFGHHCQFEDVPARILESIPSSDEYDADYITHNPAITELDTAPDMSEHEVNTQRTEYKTVGLRHFEGGWPENVDGTETDQVERYLKKFNKDAKYRGAVRSMASTVESCVKQNNTMDIFEDYFAGDHVELSSEPPSAKGVAVFRDPNPVKRSATSINWHPEGNRIAVAYSVLNFQDERMMSSRLPVKSYIWDIANPNTPDAELFPSSPLCCMRFNPKNPETLVGGSYNGLVSFFDLRRTGSSPVAESVIDSSHHDPVYDVFWVASKTHNLCASVSTDGQMLWWDTRRLSEPTERLQLDDGSGRILGGSSMEYNTEAGPAKYLVGTEQGVVLSVNLRKKKSNDCIQSLDQGAGKHHGPVYSIQRNPTHPKFFLTVGDWTARIWSEDGKTPIMTTQYCKSYLTAGCWSPTRAGVFYTARMDGVVDVWDTYHRQNSVAYSHKVGDQPLTSIAVQGTTQGGGRHVAVGDVNGTVSLLEVCESLAVPHSSEKLAVSNMLEREGRREKNLEKRAIELARKAGGGGGGGGDDVGEDRDERMEEVLRKVDAEFLAMIKDAEEEEVKDSDDA
jgi:dynein intermediate chain 2